MSKRTRDDFQEEAEEDISDKCAVFLSGSSTMLNAKAWDFVVHNLHDYYGNQDVANLEDMQKFLDGQHEDLPALYVRDAMAQSPESFLNSYHQLQVQVINAAFENLDTPIQ